METLKEILVYYSHHFHDWSYYCSPCLSIDHVLDNGGEALEFIQAYFKIGGKKKVIASFDEKRLGRISDNRLIHIVSTFFLGLRIAECYGIDTLSRNDDGFNFKYYWFLACLYHDIGYIYEEKPICEQLKMVSVDGLEAIQAVCDVKYLHNREFKTYSRDMVDLYLKGRATCTDGRGGVIDHGIAGGLMLYDGLRKQFEWSWKKRTGKNDSRESFYVYNGDRKLHCSNSHYEDYAKVADAIIAHNIFVDTLHQYADEEGIRLDGIVNQKISLSNELCFILCVADTIEPLKRNLNYIDEVSFEFENGEISIQASDDAFKNVYKNVQNMEQWLDVRVTVDGGSLIKITPIVRF